MKMDKQLINEDIAPCEEKDKTWGTFHYFALWVGMAVCIPTYMIAASLIKGGMSWDQALLTVLLGNMIVLIPMILLGHPGGKYGIPFPVLARASFGIMGSNVAALLRALVACGWFGIQCWIGGGAIYTLLLIIYPDIVQFETISIFGAGAIPFFCFLVFWLLNIMIIWKGVEAIKFLETYSAPFLIVCGLLLLSWAYVTANGFGDLLKAEGTLGENFYDFFFPSLTGMVGFWATLSLNIADFTRYAKSQRAHALGQTLGLPTTMTLFAFIGIAVTSATVAIYGEAIWDPVVLVRKFESPLVVFVSMVAVVIATLSTNVAANVVGPANDFANLWPSKITYKIGGTITGIIGIFMMPWKLIADPNGYIFTWLIGYSALLGPLAGILMIDYFLIKKTKLIVADLYRKRGAYTYYKGWNFRAILAVIIGVFPNIIGFLIQINLLDRTGLEFFVTIYHYAWFIGLFLAALSYYMLTLIFPLKAELSKAKDTELKKEPLEVVD